MGSYLQVNPTLTKPSYVDMLEFQRVSTTRYRTGSHNLKIETGRRPPKIERDERMCMCYNGVQTLKHCLLECPLLEEQRETCQIKDLESGVTNTQFRLEMERILELKCYST